MTQQPLPSIPTRVCTYCGQLIEDEPYCAYCGAPRGLAATASPAAPSGPPIAAGCGGLLWLVLLPITLFAGFLYESAWADATELPPMPDMPQPSLFRIVTTTGEEVDIWAHSCETSYQSGLLECFSYPEVREHASCDTCDRQWYWECGEPIFSGQATAFYRDGPDTTRHPSIEYNHCLNFH
jgi:hypothetical protein